MTTNVLRAPGVVDATIICFSGKYFDYANPVVDTIDIEDIARGLSKICRFGGQSLHFYSVAQHSVLVSENVPDDLAWAALFHDAAEAYVGDMVAPLKQLLPQFKEIEKRVEAAVMSCFHINPADMKHHAIRYADLRLLRTEQRDLTSAPNDHWNGLDQYLPLIKPIMALPPEEAYALFIARYYELAVK